MDNPVRMVFQQGTRPLKNAYVAASLITLDFIVRLTNALPT